MALLFGLEVFKQDAGEVSLAEAGEDRDDAFPFVFGSRCEDRSSQQRCPGADAHEQPFLGGGPAGEVNRVVLVDHQNLVDDIEVQHVGDKARPDALDRVGPWREGFVCAGLRQDR